MTRNEFTHLCLEAGFLLGTTDPHLFAETGELDDGGIRLGLYPEDEHGEDADEFSCYCDVGHIAEHRRGAVCEELLALNAAVGRRSEGMFCFDRASGHAILSTRIGAASLEQPRDLADYIVQLRELISRIRERLQEKGTQLPPSAGFTRFVRA